MTGALLLFCAGLILLYAGGEALVRGAAGLALRLGITPLAIGLTVVAFGTSSPELAVSASAAFDRLGGVALGNVVGSNICNIALILGLCALARPLVSRLQVLRLDAPIMIATALVLAAVLVDGTVGRLEGLLLVVAVVAYTATVLRIARRETAAARLGAAAGARPAVRPAGWSVVLIVVGLTVLVIGGRLFVRGAVGLATELGVPDAVIALTVVALGTSLPELATSLVAAGRGYGDIALGNIVGSNIFNALAVLGVSALVRPIGMGSVRWADVGVMVVVSGLLYPFLSTGRRLSRREGAFLLAVYAAYIAWSFTRNG